jgi:hypothetical protein
VAKLGWAGLLAVGYDRGPGLFHALDGVAQCRFFRGLKRLVGHLSCRTGAYCAQQF